MSSENKPSKEQIDKWKSRVADPSTPENVKETFRNLLKKWDKGVEEVEEAVGLKKERKPRTTKPSAEKKERKPRETKQTGDDVEKAKAEIKKRTGKTEEECEKIIEEYRSLRTKSQERKKKEEQASADNKKRVEKLEKKGDIIEGTTEKTADAVIETAKVDVVEKIEKEIEKVEDKAEKEAKKEVEKEMPKASATEKKKEVAEKVEKKVKEKTKVVVKRVVVDTSALLTSIAEALGKFDKDSQKEFLIKLRSDIDKLLSKYAMGGDVSGATQGYNITQSNLSSQSVNMFARGGYTRSGVYVNGKASIHKHPKGYYMIIDKLGYQIGDNFSTEQDAYNYVEKEGIEIKNYAKGGGIMFDGRIVLRDFNGIGGNKNKTYKLIKDDRDSDGKPYYTLIEYPSGNVMAQGDSFEEVNGYANLMSGKFAKGGGVYNRSWHQDHYRHNKSESYEVPPSKRKRKKYERGGTMFDAMNRRRGM